MTHADAYKKVVAKLQQLGTQVEMEAQVQQIAREEGFERGVWLSDDDAEELVREALLTKQ